MSIHNIWSINSIWPMHNIWPMYNIWPIHNIWPIYNIWPIHNIWKVWLTSKWWEGIERELWWVLHLFLLSESLQHRQELSPARLWISMSESSGWGSNILYPQVATGQSWSTLSHTENCVACSWPTHYSSVPVYWFFISYTIFSKGRENIYWAHNSPHFSTFTVFTVTWDCSKQLSASGGPSITWASVQLAMG